MFTTSIMFKEHLNNLKHRIGVVKFKVYKDLYRYKEVSLKNTNVRSIRKLVNCLSSSYSEKSNLTQNKNIDLRAFNPSLVGTVKQLELLLKLCVKNQETLGVRNEPNLRPIKTYVFFTYENGTIVNIPEYINRLQKAVNGLMDYFSKHHLEEGTISYANCITIYMMLSSLYTFLSDMNYVLLDEIIFD